MIHFCEKCLFWEHVAKKVSGEDFGICKDVTVNDKVALDGKNTLGEEGMIWTNAHFGCIYFRDRKSKELMNISDILKPR